jgi:hypothetical protein
MSPMDTFAGPLESAQVCTAARPPRVPVEEDGGEVARERVGNGKRLVVRGADRQPGNRSPERRGGRGCGGRVDILINNAATVEPLGPTIGIQAGDLRPSRSTSSRRPRSPQRQRSMRTP